jgi:putative Mg2+ transporter-C (MgtC) family protein
VSLADFALRLTVALGAGILIGAERQFLQRMAGLRTNALVAGGAALFVTLGPLMGDKASPDRVAANIVTGVGFLGAGVLIREGANIRGINTAATLWCCAAVGAIGGAGNYAACFIAAGAVVVANLVLRPLGRLIDRSPGSGEEVELTYRFRAVCRAKQEAHIRVLVQQSVSGSGFRLRELVSHDLDDPGLVEISAVVLAQPGEEHRFEEAVARLSIEPHVTAVGWELVDQHDPL